MTRAEPDPEHTIRKLNLAGLAIVLLLVGGAGGWATTTQLAGAVIASGTIVVESSVKKVQHPTGGVVGEILVKEGGEVDAGQVVLRLDDTITKATLGVVRSQLDETTAREARLVAERDDASAIVFPPQLTASREASAIAAMAGEEKLFESRRTARKGQRAQLRERITQTNEEIRGLSAQLAAKENELELIAKELVGVADLYRKNLVSISRYMQLERDQTRLKGERGQFIAEIARARGKISETELQIIQLDQDFRTEALKDLREAQGKIAELKERVTAAEDQLKRVDLRAPQTGIVHQLAVHTVGGVIGNGEIIMQIVPRADELVVEAKVAPSDIDHNIARASAMRCRCPPDSASPPSPIGVSHPDGSRRIMSCAPAARAARMTASASGAPLILAIFSEIVPSNSSPVCERKPTCSPRRSGSHWSSAAPSSRTRCPWQAARRPRERAPARSCPRRSGR